MANRNHLAKLEEGVDAWNQWRAANPTIEPDLYRTYLDGANLSGVDLSGANLTEAVLLNLTMSGANLLNATLCKAVLKQAKLSGTVLWKAKLRGANLSRADFCHAGLRGADLREVNLDASDLRADLSGANLSRANLSLANLTKAVLTKAKLRRAILREADLSHANLIGATMKEATLVAANLSRANLSRADLYGADMRGAKLIGATLIGANLGKANLTGADLSHANLYGANLSDANLQSADLSAARLTRATLVRTSCEKTVFSDCNVYGMSVWDVDLADAIQSNLVVTPKDQPQIQVDNLQVAQFIYLLLNNQNVREVIDTITSKVVLILGRFTPERKPVLEAMRDVLRSRGRLPVLFDFEKPRTQTTDETISTLAHMSRFVIADLTDAKSVLQELRSIVPNSPSVLIQPLLLASQEEPAMWDFFRKFPWVLEPVRYTDQGALIAALDEKVIAPAEARALPAKS